MKHSNLGLKKIAIIFMAIQFIFSSCGLIIGGTKYNAIIEVPNHSDAAIYYRGSKIGTGSTTLKIPRNRANRVVFAVKSEDCEEQQFEFKSRSFRFGSFVTSLLVFTTSPLVTGIPIPYGGIIDLAAGAVWKPNKAEVGLRKVNYKNYRYTLNYDACPTIDQLLKKKQLTPVTKESKLKELEELFKKGLISEEEYKNSRAKVLEQ